MERGERECERKQKHLVNEGKETLYPSTEKLLLLVFLLIFLPPFHSLSHSHSLTVPLFLSTAHVLSREGHLLR
jgi:hypothetical protein